MRFIHVALVLLLLLGLVGQVQAQTVVLAPNVFLRGFQLENSVRYTASFVKPSDNSSLRNVSVEITLPPDAIFLDMLVSKQVEFNVIRVNRQNAITLVWQISNVTSDLPLEPFSFTLRRPVSSEVEFYLEWQTEAGATAVENFFEVPPLIVTDKTEGQVVVSDETFLPIEGTGIQVAATATIPPLFVNVRLLANDFNPPAEYGDVWWCSLLELITSPTAEPIQVIVPLRRPVAPFTSLFLFQQQPDGTWKALDSQALVTADGLFATYTHPGGLVATGGEKDIQLAVVEAVNIPVIQEPPAEAAPPPAEAAPPPAEAAPPPVEDNKGDGAIEQIEAAQAEFAENNPGGGENTDTAPEVITIVGEDTTGNSRQATEDQRQQPQSQQNPGQEGGRENPAENRDQPSGAANPNEQNTAEDRNQQGGEARDTNEVVAGDNGNATVAGDENAFDPDELKDEQLPVLPGQEAAAAEGNDTGADTTEELKDEIFPSIPTDDTTDEAEVVTFSFVAEPGEESPGADTGSQDTLPPADTSGGNDTVSTNPPADTSGGDTTAQNTNPPADTSGGNDTVSTNPPTDTSGGDTTAQGENPPVINNNVTVTLNPPDTDQEVLPFGQGGVRVEIFTPNEGQVVQCQAGQINCITVTRRVGAGLR